MFIKPPSNRASEVPSGRASFNQSSVRVRNIKGRSALTKYPVNLNRPPPAKTRPSGSEIGAEKDVLKMDQIETLSSEKGQGAS